MAKNSPKTPISDHPFLGRREWNERYGNEVKNKEVFARLALWSSAAAVVLGAGLVWSNVQVQNVPVRVAVVETDTLTGRVIQRPALNDGEAMEVRTKAGLARYVEDLRSVYFDYGAMEKAFKRVAAMSTPKVRSVLEQRMKLGSAGAPENPQEIAKSRSVAAVVELVQPTGSPNTWTVRWTETSRAPDGAEISRKRYEGTFTVGYREVKTLEQFKANENGLFIANLDWQEISKI